MAVAVSAVLGPVAYARMFTGFSVYDDEGFFLATLRDYLGGTPLMTSTGLTLYGPFYFELYGGLFRLLGIAPDHDAGRWLTLGATGRVGTRPLPRPDSHTRRVDHLPASEGRRRAVVQADRP